MDASRRSLIAVLIAVLVLGVVGVAAAAQGPSATIGQNEIRPEPGQEADREHPQSQNDSHAPRIVPGQASTVVSSNPGPSASRASPSRTTVTPTTATRRATRLPTRDSVKAAATSSSR